MEIKRDYYLEALNDRMHNGMIKIVSGIRRSGKSYLMFTIFRNYLLENVTDENHIIALALDTLENERYLDPYSLLEYIKTRIMDERMHYVLLDEIQMVPKFEKVMNSLLHIPNADVYVTGSNSKFLSSDIITEFRGRGDEIHVYPLCFREFMQTFDGDKYEGLQKYMLYGGMPFLASIKTDEQRQHYLINLFKETYIKDILEHNALRKSQELDDLIDILASGIGAVTNPTRISSTYASVYHTAISPATINTYIGYLEDAFLISEVQRFDVKGRKYIGAAKKYYFEDTGLRNARLGFRQSEENHLMENAIYNELRMRGFAVDVGIVPVRGSDNSRKQLEIDFIATKGSDRYYIQSAYRMPDKEKEEQEKASLMKARDGFTKIVISGEIINRQRDINGIIMMSIYDFLLDPESL